MMFKRDALEFPSYPSPLFFRIEKLVLIEWYSMMDIPTPIVRVHTVHDSVEAGIDSLDLVLNPLRNVEGFVEIEFVSHPFHWECNRSRRGLLNVAHVESYVYHDKDNDIYLGLPKTLFGGHIWARPTPNLATFLPGRTSAVSAGKEKTARAK